MNNSPERSSASPETILPDVIKRLGSEAGYIPDEFERPVRCRAIIFNPEGTKVLGIVRQKPGREPYTVYPGGGIEDDDFTAVDAIRRELSEELALGATDVRLDARVLRFEDEVGGDQFYYLGVASEEFENLVIQGPEAERDPSVSGTYQPAWISLDDQTTANFQPSEVAQLIEKYR